MRIIVAPDKFAGTLTAGEAAAAIAEGWRRTNPQAELIEVPMADGGPGFLEVLSHAFQTDYFAVIVTGPDHREVPAFLLKHDNTVYIESAQACGLALMDTPDPWHATTYGVGELIKKAFEFDVNRVVVGLGGSATNDGGAGMLAALGATADKPLDQGPAGLDGVREVDITAAVEFMAGRELIIASDVKTVLLGMFGATRTFGVQKGLKEQDIVSVDRILDQFVETMLGSTPAERRIADAPGSGAAGGLGLGLLALGGRMSSGIELITEEVGLSDLAADADLLITGEGRFDFSSRDGKVVYGVAQIAAAAAKPCIVLAGDVDVGSREMRALGVESAYGLTDHMEAEIAIAQARSAISDLAQRVARSWTW